MHCWGDLRVRLYHTNLGLRTVVVRWTVYEKGPVSSLNAVILGADNDPPSYLLIKSLPSERPVITRRGKKFESLKVHSRRLSWMYDDNAPSLSTRTSVQIQRIYAPKSRWKEADIVGAANGETILRHSLPLTRLPKNSDGIVSKTYLWVITFQLTAIVTCLTQKLGWGHGTNLDTTRWPSVVSVYRRLDRVWSSTTQLSSWFWERSASVKEWDGKRSHTHL